MYHVGLNREIAIEEVRGVGIVGKYSTDFRCSKENIFRFLLLEQISDRGLIS